MNTTECCNCFTEISFIQSESACGLCSECFDIWTNDEEQTTEELTSNSPKNDR